MKAHLFYGESKNFVNDTYLSNYRERAILVINYSDAILYTELWTLKFSLKNENEAFQNHYIKFNFKYLQFLSEDVACQCAYLYINHLFDMPTENTFSFEDMKKFIKYQPFL